MDAVLVPGGPDLPPEAEQAPTAVPHECSPLMLSWTEYATPLRCACGTYLKQVVAISFVPAHPKTARRAVEADRPRIAYACANCGEHEGQRFRWTTCHGWTCYCCDPSGRQHRVGYQTVKVLATDADDAGGVA